MVIHDVRSIVNTENLEQGLPLNSQFFYTRKMSFCRTIIRGIMPTKRVLPQSGAFGDEKTRNSFSPLDDIGMEGKNKHVGRPHLKNGKRTKKISVRFSEEEFSTILSLEKLLGLKRTNIIRKRVLEVDVQLIFDGRSVLSSIDQIGLELSRTGNNINQLARYANILNKQRVLSPVIFTRYIKELDRHSLHLKNLNLEIKKILRLMSS